MRAERWLVAGLFLLAVSGCRFDSSAIVPVGTHGNAKSQAGGAGTDNTVSASRDDSAGMSGTAPGGSGGETGGSSSSGSGGSSSSGAGGSNGNATAGANGGGTGGSSSGATAGSNGGGTGGSSSNATAGSNGGGTGGSSSGATAGSNSSAAGGMGSSGSSGSANGGSSGGGTAGTGGTVTLPTDGNQLSVCTAAQGQCNKGFACYSSGGTGRGFCSKGCSKDKDCEGLEPTSAKYVCQTGVTTPVCEIPCKSATDTNSCPADMTCQQTGVSQGSGSGPGAGGGTTPELHCKYPSETSGPWGPCGDGTHDCDAPLFCAGTSSSPSGIGYCTKFCSSDHDCDPTTSGSITPTCITVDPGSGMTMPTKICGLDCPNAKDGCPDHESCTMVMTAAGPGMRCEYD